MFPEGRFYPLFPPKLNSARPLPHCWTCTALRFEGQKVLSRARAHSFNTDIIIFVVQNTERPRECFSPRLSCVIYIPCAQYLTGSGLESLAETRYGFSPRAQHGSMLFGPAGDFERSRIMHIFRYSPVEAYLTTASVLPGTVVPQSYMHAAGSSCMYARSGMAAAEDVPMIRPPVV